MDTSIYWSFTYSVSAINAATVEVKFNEAVLDTDVIDGSGDLKNVAFTAETVDGVVASTPGTLKAVLSTDGKTLTLTTAVGSKFDGTYTVNVSKNVIQTVNGDYFAAYEGTLVATDSTRPTLKGITYNPAGTIAYLEFSEPLSAKDSDFGLISIARADGVALNSATVSGFTASDITLDASKRNVVDVALADVNVADAGKDIKINFVGLKDQAGNLVSPNPVSITVNKDVTVKAQAAITSVRRSSLTKLEITFDKELNVAPSVTIATEAANTSAAVSLTDPKVYEVTLTSAEQALTGIKNVVTNSWDAFNTAAPVTVGVTKIVDFTVEKVAPTISSTTLEEISNVNYLVVNFSEDVTLADLAAGTLTGTISKPNGDLVASPTYDFAAPTFYGQSLTATKSKSIKINLDTLEVAGTPTALVPGTYNVEVSAAIAKDVFGNDSVKKTTSFDISTASTKLPAPSAVASKANTPSTIVVSFANKLDVVSAQTMSNYTIEGAVIESAIVTSNAAGAATVELKIQAGSVAYDGARQVTIKNVKGFDNSFIAMADYSAVKSFNENVAPKLATTNAAVLTATDKITVDFNENLVDTITGLDLEVFQNGIKIGSTSALSGTDASKVVITLTSAVSSTTGLVVKAASTIDLTDANMNSVVFTDTTVN